MQYHRTFSFFISVFLGEFFSGFFFFLLLSFELNSIRLGGPAHGIVTKTVHKTLPGVVGVKRVGGGRVGMVGVKG